MRFLLYIHSTLYNASQIWGLRDNFVTHRILKLQNLAMRLTTFNGFRVSSTLLYVDFF